MFSFVWDLFDYTIQIRWLEKTCYEVRSMKRASLLFFVILVRKILNDGEVLALLFMNRLNMKGKERKRYRKLDGTRGGKMERGAVYLER